MSKLSGAYPLTIEIQRLESIIAEVHSWIVCSAICTDEDMMNNAERIAQITAPNYEGAGGNYDEL